jgi:hypothetical protein
MEETAAGETTRFPPPFCEVVEKWHSQAFDLAYGFNWALEPPWLIPQLQLRDSTGLSPVSSFGPPFRG